MTEDELKEFNALYARYNVECSQKGERVISQSKFFLKLLKFWKINYLKES